MSFTEAENSQWDPVPATPRPHSRALGRVPWGCEVVDFPDPRAGGAAQHSHPVWMEKLGSRSLPFGLFNAAYSHSHYLCAENFYFPYLLFTLFLFMYIQTIYIQTILIR